MILMESNSYENSLNRLFRWQLGASFYMAVLQLAGFVFIGRYLGYKELGIFTIFQLVFRFSTAMFDPGMYVSIIQKNSFSGLILKSLKKNQYTIAIVCLVLLMLFYFIDGKYLDENTFLVVLSFGLLITIVSGAEYPALLTRQLRQKEMSIAQMIGASLEIIFILVFIWHFDPLVIFTTAFFIRFLSYYLICHYHVKKEYPAEAAGDPVSQHLHFSRYQVLNQGLSFVQGNFDTVLILFVFGLTTLGPYNFASELSYLLFSKINPLFNKAVFPVLAKQQHNAKERQDIISGSLLSHALLCVSLYLLVYFQLDWVIPIAFKDEEGLILIFSKYIMIMAMIRSVNNLIFNKLLALGESKNLLIWNISILIFNYLFIAIIYITGASIEHFLLINIFVSFAVLCFSVYKLLPYLEDKKKTGDEILKYLGFFVACFLYLDKLQGLNLLPVWNVSLSLLFVLGLSLLFYKEKLKQLARFRII